VHEALSYGLQDHDRAIIVGETTYGKGLVQQLQRVGKENEGLQMKFTIGKYYTPSGRCIQNKVYTSKADGGLGTDETVIKNEDRKVFITEHGRKVSSLSLHIYIYIYIHAYIYRTSIYV
jgi:carboxyl-terminal processing protease